MRRQEAEQWDAGYVRVSTDMQVERDALQNQVQALEAYAVAHGHKLRLYKDEGISAKDTDRPDLQRLLGDVQAGRVRNGAESGQNGGVFPCDFSAANTKHYGICRRMGVLVMARIRSFAQTPP